MEKTIVTTKLDFRTLKYANLFIMKFKRKTSIWFLVTALISAAVVVYDLAFVEDTTYAFAILGGIFILYSGYQYFNLEKKLDTQLARFFYNKRVSSQIIEVTDEKLVVTRSFELDKPAEFDWSFITEIYEMPQFYMLMMGRGAPIIIDRSDEAIVEGTQDNLDNIIKDKIATKPYKQTDQDIVKRPITYVHPEFPEVVSEEVENDEATEEVKVLEAEVLETEEDDYDYVFLDEEDKE